MGKTGHFQNNQDHTVINVEKLIDLKLRFVFVLIVS